MPKRGAEGCFRVSGDIERPEKPCARFGRLLLLSCAPAKYAGSSDVRLVPMGEAARFRPPDPPIAPGTLLSLIDVEVAVNLLLLHAGVGGARKEIGWPVPLLLEDVSD